MIESNYWSKFWGHDEKNPYVIAEKLYEYYYNFVPMLWTSFQTFFETPEQVRQDFEKSLGWYQQRVKTGHVFDIEKAYSRLNLWISILDPSSVEEIVIPTSHQRCPNPQLKLENWRLPTLTKTVAIIGDSNLSRIEPFSHSSCQVESYPGARIEHIANLFANYDSKSVPRILILSIGINDATNRQPHLRTNFGTILNNLPSPFQQTKVILCGTTGFSITT